MASKLAVYNQALRRLGDDRLASLTESRGPRFHLDEIWADGFINELLEAAQWNFAIRAVEQTYDSGIEPEFGYLRVFPKPADWIRTVSFCSDERFNNPINAYADEAGYWSCDNDTIYVRYISNDGEFGSDLGKWPPSFTTWACTRLAWKIAPLTTRGQGMARELRQEDAVLLRTARSKDAVNEGVRFTPAGNWLMARSGGSRNRENG